tara:strand:- start:690 stop:854 length:165 start_codon:yes stop_codon:yes gene_type:complete
MEKRSVHFNNDIREMTIQMWLNGSSYEEIDRALAKAISNKRRRRRDRGGFTGKN